MIFMNAMDALRDLAGASAHAILPDHPDGLEADLESGEHEWTWTPTADYLHDPDESPDLKKLNGELNHIPKQ